MGQTTGISWTDSTWSPLRARVKDDALEIASKKGYASLVQILSATKPNGELRTPPGKVGHHCEHASPGCGNCYSETNNGRCLPANGTGLPFDRRSRDLVDMFLDEKIMEWPLRWKKARRIFVESQSDLFGEFVPFAEILRVHIVMLTANQHTYQLLTKRADRMKEFYLWWDRTCPGHATPENLWLGVSVEDQQRADERIPILLQTPAAVRWISYEPALGPVDFLYSKTVWPDGPQMCCSGDECGCKGMPTEPPLIQGMSGEHIAWIVVGGESGPGARPFDTAWARSVIAQCSSASVPVFMKQLGRHPLVMKEVGTGKGGSHVPIPLKDRKGGDMSEWPADLRIRQFPEVAR